MVGGWCLAVGGWWLVVVGCWLLVARCWLSRFVAPCVLFVGCCVFVCPSLRVACCWFVVWCFVCGDWHLMIVCLCLLFAVLGFRLLFFVLCVLCCLVVGVLVFWCSVFVVRCALFVVRWSLLVVRCLALDVVVVFVRCLLLIVV